MKHQSPFTKISVLFILCFLLLGILRLPPAEAEESDRSEFFAGSATCHLLKDQSSPVVLEGKSKGKRAKLRKRYNKLNKQAVKLTRKINKLIEKNVKSNPFSAEYQKREKKISKLSVEDFPNLLPHRSERKS